MKVNVDEVGAARQAAALVEAHRQELEAFVRAMVGDVRAEDIVQEAYLRLARAPALSELRNPKAYLFRIGANLARDELRRRQRQQAGLQALSPPESSPAAADIALSRERLERLRVAIEQLPKKCRRVFLLRKFEALSYAAIAAREGISEKTVENHIARALKLLHQLVDQAD